MVDWHAVCAWRGGLASLSILTLLAATPAAASAVAHPADWPSVPRAIAEQPDTERFVDQLLAAMTPEEKVGQLIQADIDSITPADLAHYPLGSILAGGNAAPSRDVHSTGAKWLDLTDALHVLVSLGHWDRSRF